MKCCQWTIGNYGGLYYRTTLYFFLYLQLCYVWVRRIIEIKLGFIMKLGFPFLGTLEFTFINDNNLDSFWNNLVVLKRTVYWKCRHHTSQLQAFNFLDDDWVRLQLSLKVGDGLSPRWILEKEVGDTSHRFTLHTNADRYNFKDVVDVSVTLFSGHGLGPKLVDCIDQFVYNKGYYFWH